MKPCTSWLPQRPKLIEKALPLGLLLFSMTSFGCARKSVVILPSDEVPMIVKVNDTYVPRVDSICMPLGTYKKVFDNCADALIPQ